MGCQILLLLLKPLNLVHLDQVKVDTFKLYGTRRLNQLIMTYFELDQSAQITQG